MSCVTRRRTAVKNAAKKARASKLKKNRLREVCTPSQKSDQKSGQESVGGDHCVGMGVRVYAV